ncbi:hypothetical protein INQ13_25145, partial [Escherichia coli]|uniref:hypothetical protein n=1 Tax=Escherichia coli TaxID=562 RepID=UPI0019334C7D
SVRARATSAPGVPFYPHDAAGGHHRSRAYIEDALSSVVAGGYGHVPDPVVAGIRGGDRAVVVSHHAPRIRSLPPEVLPDL